MAAMAFAAGTYEYRCKSGSVTVRVAEDVSAPRFAEAVWRMCKEVWNGKEKDGAE